MSKLATLTLIALLGLSLGACNTIHGFGHDVENAGDAISDAAD